MLFLNFKKKALKLQLGTAWKMSQMLMQLYILLLLNKMTLKCLKLKD